MMMQIKKLLHIGQLCATYLVMAGGLTVVLAQPAAAFNPERIIDDAVFTNKNSMTVGDIQNFLNSKVPTCDTWHSPGSGSQGNQPPWTCLKNYSEGGRSAAQIIYDAAQQYNINPQVILVTLQKENGLITDTWPYHWQYRTAMGMGCPDGAPCDSQYYGFANQINQGVRHLAGFYNQSAGWYIPYRPGSSYVKYHPNANCGGTTLNIQNRATAALYSYTPYQPNGAALNNMYGTGDGCSSYGNRNFWRDFTNWFGSTLGEPNEVDLSWLFENLEGDGAAISGYDSRVGQTPSLVEFNSTLQSFYYDSGAGNLRRAYADSGGWHFDVLDGAGGADGRIDANVGVMTDSIVYGGNLHIFYYDVTNGNLRHGWTADGSSWSFETLDGAGGPPGVYNANVGQNPSIVVQNGVMHVFYYDVSNNNLRHGWLVDGLGWRFENLDGDPGSIGRKNGNIGENSTALILGETLQLFYYDASDGNLRHAWNHPTLGWMFENLDGDPGSIGRKNSNLGVDPTAVVVNNNLQLFYLDASDGNLRHAWTTPGGWRFENLDGDPGSIGHKNAYLGLMPKVVSHNGEIYVFYYDQTNGGLRHAYANDTGWHFGNLDGIAGGVSQHYADSGYDPAAISYNGSLQLFFYDHTNGNLRHAWGVR